MSNMNVRLNAHAVASLVRFFSALWRAVCIQARVPLAAMNSKIAYSIERAYTPCAA
ncbi:Uncharacterised protein [Vibrio cholerae]|nr:Uncharacterised protein [Vibrio cholerae]